MATPFDWFEEEEPGVKTVHFKQHELGILETLILSKKRAVKEALDVHGENPDLLELNARLENIFIKIQG